MRYGWKKDSPDRRDRVFYCTPPPAPLPPSVDLRETGHLPPVYDQGELGSCTANAIAAAVDFERSKQGLPFITPSRLFIYFNERTMEGTPDEDSGAQIRDGIKSVSAQGVCPESDWPYDISRFAVRPAGNCYTEAAKFKASVYSRVVQSSYWIKHCLAVLGRPIVFGFFVFESFESRAVAQCGIMPLPQSSEQILGGHAVLGVGYNDARGTLMVRNSWSQQWGQDGYFEMPYRFFLDPSMCSDLWTILAEEA